MIFLIESNERLRKYVTKFKRNTKNIDFFIPISIDGDPSTLLNFNYFTENFTGQRVTTKRCISCETESVVPEEIIDVLVTLSTKSEFSENFIQVIQSYLLALSQRFS